MINKGLMSSNSVEWATPIEFFKKLNSEFHFELDPCATHENHKCPLYYTKEEDGLSLAWPKGINIYVNPPYGREISKWVKKCYDTWNDNGKSNTIVMLLPARTDTKWFHDYIYGKATEIRFIKGRLKFNDCGVSAPFPSMVVVYEKKY
jgi:site-specific DNA-methyltransferase (adenine-specific)